MEVGCHHKLRKTLCTICEGSKSKAHTLNAIVNKYDAPGCVTHSDC